MRRTLQVSAAWAGGLAALGLALAGCQTPRPPGADHDLRFHEWWNYYEAGLAAMQTGGYVQARGYFEAALGLRPGARFPRDKDEWRARRQGLHFVERYFPNRELGITLYRLGEWAEAERFLEKSHRQTPSARGAYYLNEVRQRGMDPDRSAPVIEFDAASAISRTALRRREVGGRVRAVGRVAGLRIQGADELVELAETERVFRQAIALRTGTNRVTVEARDLGGRAATRTLEWVTDWQVPLLGVRSVERTAGGWKMDVVCTDDGPLRRVSVGGRVRYEQAAGEARRRVEVVAELGGGPLTVEVEDEAGNVLRRTLDPAVLSAGLREPGGAIQLAATSTAGLGGALQDVFPPRIRLKNAPRLTIVGEEVLLYGEVRDAGAGLRSVGLEHAALAPPPLEAEGGWLEFDFRAEVAVGTNLLRVVAEDGAGNRSTSAVTVVRLAPEYLDADARMGLVLGPVTGAVPAAYADEVFEAVGDWLLEGERRFNFVRRDPETLRSALREQQLDAAELTDPQARLELGRMFTADALLSVKVRPGDRGHELIADVVGMSDGAVLARLDAYDPGAGGTLEQTTWMLVAKLKQSFPLVEGVVTEVARGQPVINLGRDQGLVEGALFVVLDGEQGTRMRKAEGRLVQVRLASMGQQRSGAKVFVGGVTEDKTGKIELRPGDRVYAR